MKMNKHLSNENTVREIEFTGFNLIFWYFSSNLSMRGDNLHNTQKKQMSSQ